jgi:hypothetical protein
MMLGFSFSILTLVTGVHGCVAGLRQTQCVDSRARSIFEAQRVGTGVALFIGRRASKGAAMLRPASFFIRLIVPFAALVACDGSREPDVEILPSDSLAVLLSESNGAPIAVLAEQRVLAGKQFVLLSRSGGGEPAERLIELDLRPGPQQIDLGDDDEPVVVVFEAVAEEEVVEIELLRPDEAELSAGTWVEVDVVGVTKDGAHVRGVYPRFAAGDETHLGYFAYRFDPEAEPRTLSVEALDRQLRARFKGTARATD